MSQDNTIGVAVGVLVGTGVGVLVGTGVGVLVGTGVGVLVGTGVPVGSLMLLGTILNPPVNRIPIVSYK